MMAGLKHENIINLIGFVEDLENGKGWIVMSWEPNGNVREFLASAEWEIPERISLVRDYPLQKLFASGQLQLDVYSRSGTPSGALNTCTPANHRSAMAISSR